MNKCTLHQYIYNDEYSLVARFLRIPSELYMLHTLALPIDFMFVLKNITLH